MYILIVCLLLYLSLCFFFFKQKTAYEMRISDWSSDVCSSDLNDKQNRTHILEFVRQAMKPAQYSRTPERYEPMRALVNQALAFAGLVVDQTGAISVVEAAQTLPEAQRRARELRADLEGRGVHADVWKFCRAELLDEH